jgi:glycogen operon protein
VTCHDGFTLLDLLSYERKRNEANGEHNRDGESHNRGWNCGVEGPTDDAAVNALRARQQRNLILTLLLSQGVPMLLAGDELGRTQQGNNNAYCHDSPLTWIDWSAADFKLMEFTRRLIQFVCHQPGLRPGRWLDGRPAAEWAEKDVSWFGVDGIEFGVLDWDRAAQRALCVHVASHPDPSSTSSGREQHRYLFLFNADMAPVPFRLPPALSGPWRAVFDTAEQQAVGVSHAPGDMVTLLPYSAHLYQAAPLDEA